MLPMRAIACSCRTCAATGPRDSSRLKRCATDNRRRWPRCRVVPGCAQDQACGARRLRLGRTTAAIVAALWPERVKSLVSVSGYLIGSQKAAQDAASARSGVAVVVPVLLRDRSRTRRLREIPHDFAKLIWKLASPKWAFDDATFDRSAKSLDNPDHVDIVIHNYRWRLSLAKGEAKYDAIEAEARDIPRDRGPDHHPGGRRQRRAASAARELRKTFHRQVRTPLAQRRHRPQSAAGSAARIRAGHHRFRSS